MIRKLILAAFLLPVMALMATGEEEVAMSRGGEAPHRGGEAHSYDGRRGSDYMTNEYWRNRAYVDPGYYYGGGYAVPYRDNGSGPGEIDDSDALYESYLQSNPPIPAPM